MKEIWKRGKSINFCFNKEQTQVLSSWREKKLVKKKAQDAQTKIYSESYSMLQGSARAQSTEKAFFRSLQMRSKAKIIKENNFQKERFLSKPPDCSSAATRLHFNISYPFQKTGVLVWTAPACPWPPRPPRAHDCSQAFPETMKEREIDR